MEDFYKTISHMTWLQLSLWVFGTAIAILLISSISRLAYYACRIQMLLQEMQADLRKLTMMSEHRYMQSPRNAAPHEKTPSSEPADVVE